MSTLKQKRSPERKKLIEMLESTTERRWAGLVQVKGQGIVEYQFDAEGLKDAVSYIKDNVMDDFGVKITGSNIKKLEIIK